MFNLDLVRGVPCYRACRQAGKLGCKKHLSHEFASLPCLTRLLLGAGRLEESIERLEGCLKIQPDHDKCTAKLSSAKDALEKKMAAFKEQIDEAISKAEKMRSRGEL